MTALVLENIAAIADLDALKAAQESVAKRIAALKADAIAKEKADAAAARVAAREAKLIAKIEAKAALRAITGETRGRPEGTATFDDKWGVIEGLKLIAAANGQYHYNDAGAAVSRVLTLQLVDRGYVEAVKVPNKEGQRGRAKLVYRVAGKGRSYLALSAKWKK